MAAQRPPHPISRPDPAQVRIGAILRDKWRVTALLGQGGMSIVYGAEHRNGRSVAIKMLRPELAAAPSSVERFLSEGYVANRIAHPAIVSILDDDRTDDGVPFLVMERLHGASLEARLRTAPLSCAEVLVMADRVLEALRAAHGAGVVHCDIKPDNIFLTQRREIKLLDFGIARCREIRAISAEVMGTPAYMPPEQARGQWDLVDERSDLFSLAATAYALLTGTPPRSDASAYLELAAAMHAPLPPIQSVRADVPDAVARWIDRGVMLDRAKRWADVEQMRQAVHEAWVALTGHPLATLQGTRPIDRLLPPILEAPPDTDPASETRPMTTAHPWVSSGVREPPSPPGRRARFVLAGFGTAAAVGLMALSLLARSSVSSAGPTAAARESSSPSEAADASSTSVLSIVAASAAPLATSDAPPSPGKSDPVMRSAAQVEPPRRVTPRAAPRPRPSSASAPSAVDPLQRRK